MTTRRGLVITERASCSTAAGIVAENIALWSCLDVHAARISSVCSNNPSSNNLSASSRTRYSTLLVNFAERGGVGNLSSSRHLLLMPWTNLMGVEMSKSYFLRLFESSLNLSIPRFVNMQILKFHPFVNFLISLSIYISFVHGPPHLIPVEPILS